MSNTAHSMPDPSALLEDLLRSGQRVEVPAAGQSMGPAFARADTLIVEALPDKATLRPGRVVLFLREGHWLAHRALASRKRKGKRQWLTRGDDARSFDGWVDASNIHGQVIALRCGEERMDCRGPRWWALALRARLRALPGRIRRRLF